MFWQQDRFCTITLVLYIGSLPILDIYSNSDLDFWPNDTQEQSNFVQTTQSTGPPAQDQSNFVRTFDWSWAGGPVLWVVRTKFDWSWAGGPVLWVVRTKFDWSWAGGPVLWVAQAKFDWSIMFQKAGLVFWFTVMSRMFLCSMPELDSDGKH
jgi:hypothetical protein